MNTEIKSINVESGVNEKGEGFVHIFVHNCEDAIWTGQLNPTIMRKMAFDWIEAAEASEQDAAVLRTVRKLELPDRMAGLIITELRDTRKDES